MAAQETDHPLIRLTFFSDAVFAIAITLLVIEIHVPHVPAGSPDGAYLEALGELIPSFIGFLISFAVIGLFWAGHHRAFSLARRYDPRIVPWNLMLLGTIAFMPFVTAFLSANSGGRVPDILYWSWLSLTALLNLRVLTLATRPPIVGEDVPADRAARVRLRSLSVVAGALTSLAIAFFVPRAAPLGMATIPLWRWLLGRSAARGQAERPAGRETPDRPDAA